MCVHCLGYRRCRATATGTKIDKCVFGQGRVELLDQNLGAEARGSLRLKRRVGKPSTSKAILDAGAKEGGKPRTWY